MSDSRIRLAMVGVGGMARSHLRSLLKQTDTTDIAVLCEPSSANYELAAGMFREAGLAPPPNIPDFEAFAEDAASSVDAAFIITPHNQHFLHASTLLRAGLDVLLEKPMVLNTREALDLINVQRETGRLLVVAFNGSLSPAIRTGAEMLRSGALGPILSVHATVWQNWQNFTNGTWRQVPEISGGGFLFDTGAHLLNTVTDLLGEPFALVSAFMDDYNAPVDLQSVVIARTRSGVMVSLNATGRADGIGSDVRVICEKGTLITGVWGERLLIQGAGETTPALVDLPPSLGVWETFLRVRSGELKNPSPPEMGLRMIQLWDAARASAAQGGAPVRVEAV